LQALSYLGFIVAVVWIYAIANEIEVALNTITPTPNTEILNSNDNQLPLWVLTITLTPF
jgi:hypothetical protein